METQQIILLIINVLGGAAVIISYIYGLKAQPDGANALWGGVPVNIRSLYGVSMIISALAYFALIYFILFRINPSGTNLEYSFFYVVFLVILVASAFWMPLTNMYVSNPATALWIGIRVVLALVGLGSITLLWGLLILQVDARGIAYWLAVAGAGYFSFHTAILDAIIWPALFK